MVAEPGQGMLRGLIVMDYAIRKGRPAAYAFALHFRYI